MENTNDIPASPSSHEEISLSAGIDSTDTAVTYPDKPELEESKSRISVWLRSLSSLALYFVIGYFFFNKDWLLVLVLTGVVVFHELGHFLAMKLYNYTDLGIFFIPLLGAYASGTKREISQTQSAIIILAGPVPGIIAGVIAYYFAINHDNLFMERMSWILIFLNLLNLFPIYPLDGGQLLNRLFLDESAIIGKIFIVISALALAWFFWSISFYPLLLFPVMMMMRLFTDIKHDKLIKKVEEEGVDLNTSYEDISNEQYWKIRYALIKHHPDLIDIRQAPPYEYSEKEDKIVTTMQGLLQRIIIMDLSLAGKIIIMLIWLGCFAAPLLIGMPLRLFY
jgi:stage IV sporulation protein FB